MIGGKDQCIAYSQFLHILAHGRGNNGDVGIKSTAFRTMSSLNMTIHVCAPADLVPYTKE